MRGCVLGGNGFIGSHLVDALRQAKWHVTVYDRIDEARYQSRYPDVDYVIGELGNRKLLESVLAQMDVVFHLVSTTIPQTSNEAPIFDVRTNVVDTIALLETCVKNHVPKIVFVSSGGTVYGIPERLPISEDHPTNPICSYGITKLTIEKYLHLFHHLYGLDYTIIRPSNPYGERQNPQGLQGVGSVFLGRIAAGMPIIVWGDGSIVRDYFYVADLARACLVAATTEKKFKVFNIGSGCGYSINELIEMIRVVVDRPFQVVHKPGRTFDVPELVLDIRRAKTELNWRPQVPFSDGLARTWEWIQKLHTY